MRNMPSAVVVLGVMLMTVAVAQGQSLAQESLREIGPVRVYVAPIDSEAERDGLNRQSLQTAVELRLRQSRIPVNNESEVSLWVLLNTTKDDDGLYACSLGVSLQQAVTVASNGVVLFGTTWKSNRSVGMGGANNLRQLREFVLDQVDEFSNDYLAVNPSP